MKTIAVIGTFDTKGAEHAFVAEIIRGAGHQTLLIDVGGLREPQVTPDISSEEVAAAGGIDLPVLVLKADRGAMIAALAQAAPALLLRLAARGKIHGVIALGGTGGTAIGTAAMRALPLGFPKVMVSTVASGNVAPYVGVKDIVMIPSIVDIAGLNRLSRQIFIQAAGAICGMVSAVAKAAASAPASGAATTKPLIVASMFGNTTKAVERARAVLESAGYEVLVFHATGTGGRTMESLIETGLVAGVLDLTTTEWADELVGGVFSAGPSRLEAAARHGVPAIIAPGCLDMVNFGAPDSVPAKFARRILYQHNPQVTLMRTTPAECAELGRIIAEKVNLSTGPVTVLLPLRAISVISEPGGAFHDPAADAALFGALKENLRRDIPVVELDCTINAPEFAEACAGELLANLAQKPAAILP
ncbi:MAG: Tm-1-like ATP-binding domain-containing protein [Opitutaceae bacterium]|nr:Tm-1-like ATP-binding domain-containing protein [Opitutaceae bacterium]